MKIEFKNNVEFADVKIGEVFEYNRRIYMKIELGCEDYNSVNLNDGMKICCQADKDIKIVKGTVIIEG